MVDRSVERAAGRVLMVGLAGTGITTDEEPALRDLAPGGVIAFRRNLAEPGGWADLVRALRELLPASPWIAIDQEGGRVSRLEPWIGPTPTGERLAAAGADDTRAFGTATGLALRTLGFNLDFAPVVDLCPADTPNGIGDRSFGTSASGAAELAGAFLDGLQGTGVAGCLKHFPGLGRTAVDSHVELPTCPLDREQLEREHLVPFRELAPRAAAVMVGHGAYPALDGRAERPATLSPAIVGELLISLVGFRGLVVSDDLEMGAVAPLDAGGAAAVGALRAGCDLLPYCSDLDRARWARDALAREAERDEAFRLRLFDAAARVRGTAAAWPESEPDPRAFTAAAHALRALAATLA